MTQNDIDYYVARNQRRNMRLQRKETKRHNLAQEQAANAQAAASMIGAQASAASAQAALANAETNKLQYQLGWEKEYGFEYGTQNPKDSLVVLDITSGEQITYRPTSSGYNTWMDNRKGDTFILLPGTNTYGIPNTYIQGLIDIERGKADVGVKESQKTKNFWDTVKTGAQTVYIITEEARQVKRLFNN